MDGDVSNLVEETATIQAPIVHSIEFISSNRVKLLEFFLHIPYQKIERFMRLDPLLVNFPIKDENNKLLELSNIGRLTKAAVMKSTFAKSLVRDAWVNLRLKCLVLLRIAAIHMRALRIEEYWQFIQELRKEVTSRLNTYADEEAYVFAVLLAMEDMKEHLRKHDLDKFIEQYQISIKDALGHLKRSDFSQLLSYRVNAAVGYAARLAQNSVVVEERLCRAIDIFEQKQTTQNTLKQQQRQLEWELEQMKEIERLHELQQQDKQQREEEKFFKEFLKQQEEMKQSDDLDYQLLFNLYYTFLQKQEAQRSISQLHNNINNPININNILLNSASRTQSQHETQVTKQQSMMMILSSPDIGQEQNPLEPQKPSFQAQIDEYKNRLLVQQSKCDEEGLNTKNWIISEADRFIFYFCQLQLFKVTIDGCSQIEENMYKSIADKAEGLIQELKKERHRVAGKNELIAQFTEFIESIKPDNISNTKKVKKTKNLQDNNNSLEKILSKITEKDRSDEENNNQDGMKGSIGASSPSRTLSKYSADYQAPKNLQDYIESASNKRSLHLRSCSNTSYNTNASPKQHKVPFQKLFVRSSFHDHTNSAGEMSDQRQHSKSTKENNEAENVGEAAGVNTSNIVRRKKNKHTQSETGLIVETKGYISPFDIPPMSPNSSNMYEGFHLLIPNSPIQKQANDKQNYLKIQPIQIHDSTDTGIPNIIVTSSEIKNEEILKENHQITDIQSESKGQDLPISEKPGLETAQNEKIQEPTPRQRTKSSDLLKDYSIIIQAPQEKDEIGLKSNQDNKNQISPKQVEQQINTQTTEKPSKKSISASLKTKTEDIQTKVVEDSRQEQLQKENKQKKETFLGEFLQLNDTQLSPANQTMMHERKSSLGQVKLLNIGNQGISPVNSRQTVGEENTKQKCEIANNTTDVIGNFTEQTENIIKIQEPKQQQQQQQNQLSRKSLVQASQKKGVSQDTSNSQIIKVLPNTSQISITQQINAPQSQKAQFSVILSQNYLQSSSHLPMKTFSENTSNPNKNEQKKSNILSRLLGDSQTICSLEEQLGLTRTQRQNTTLNKTKNEPIIPQDQQVKTDKQGVEEKRKSNFSEHRRWKTQTEERDIIGIHDEFDESSVVSQQQQFLSNKKINTEQDHTYYQTSNEHNNLRTSEDETAYSNGRKGHHLRMSSDSFQKYSHLVNPNYKTQSTTNFQYYLDKNESTSKNQYQQQKHISQIQSNSKSEAHSNRSFQANMSNSMQKNIHNNAGISSNQQHRNSLNKKNTFKGNNSLQQYLQRMQSSASDSSLKIIDSDCAQQTTTPWSAVSPSTAEERQKKKNSAKIVVHSPKLLLNAFHDQSKSFNSDRTDANQVNQDNDIADDINQNQNNKNKFFYQTHRDSHMHDSYFARLPSQKDTSIQSLKNLRLLFHTSRIIRNTIKDPSKSKFLQTQTSLTSNGDYGRLERGDTLVTIDTQGGDMLENSRSGLILHEKRFDNFFSQSRQERENNKQDGNDGDLSLSFSCEETELDRRKRRVKEVTMKTVSQMPAQELVPQVYESELSKVSKSIAFSVQKASLARDFEEVLQKTNFRFSLLPAYSQPQQQPLLKTDREIISSSSSQSLLSSQNQLSIQQQDNSPVGSIQEIAESIENQEDKMKQVSLNKKMSNNPSPRDFKPQNLHIPLSQSSSLANPVERLTQQARGSITTSAISQEKQNSNQGVRLSSRIALNVNSALTPGVSISMTPGTNFGMTPSMSLAFTPQTNFGLTPGMSIGLTPRMSPGLTPRINIISDEKRGSNVKNQSSLLGLPNGSFSQTSALLMNPQLSIFKGSRPATPNKVPPTVESKKPSINVGTNLLQLIQDQQRFRRKSITKPIQPPPSEKESAFQRDPSMETVKQIKNIVTELNQAKQDLLDSSRGIISKQNTLFDQNSPSNKSSPSTKNLLQSVVSKFKPTTASTFQKRSLVTKNSFDSDKSEDMKTSAQFEDEPKKLIKPKLRRLKVFSESQENSDEEEQPPAPATNLIGQQMLPTGKAAVSSPITANNSSFSGFKSINSIAMMFLGKKHWYNVQNKDDLTRSQIQRGDAISRKITELNLRFPVVSFCTHRIGRFQNWKIHFVEYYPSNKCFQINFLSIDNLFYKMFIPARDFKFFTSEQQDSFVTIWPVVLSYLLDYMTAKKIELRFEQEASQRKKISFVDTGIGTFFSHQSQDSSVQALSKELLQYKNSIKEKQGKIPPKSSARRNSEEDDSIISNDKMSARTCKTKFSFFLGLVRKESYFPTFRDALAAAKIKKIFEILLYRYMYDQLRPTGKKLVLKKDASTQRYKTLSKKIQKLENDLERSQVKQQSKMKAGNSVDTILSQKFGTLQLRKLVQKDVMKIPDKSEYQIEQIWKLRHRDTPYQLCSFIQKTDAGTYYLVSFSLAFKKDYNALLTVFLKKHDDGKGLKGQFDKIIQIQQLKKPMHVLNEEELLKEKAQKEYRLLSLIDSQSTNPNPRSSLRRPSVVKLPTTPVHQTPEISSTQKKPISQKIFQDEDFKEILTAFDLNQLIRSVVLTQKIPKKFKHLCIKNIKRRIVITGELLFLKLDKAEIIRRKQNQPPEILVETKIPSDADPRMQDFNKKDSFFSSIFDKAYVNSEFEQEKPTGKHRGAEQDDNELSDSNDDSFNNFTFPSLKIKEVEEEFDRLEKVERIDNSLFHELTFRCSGCDQNITKIHCAYKSKGLMYFMTAELHGEYNQATSMNDSQSSAHSAHILVRIFSPENRAFKSFTTRKPKAFALFHAFKNPQFSNAFKPPINVNTSRRSAGDFSAAILKLCYKLTIGEITKRVEVAVPNLASLPAHETLKLVLLKNNFFMETQRSFKRFFIIDEITSFGKVYLQLTVFFDNPEEMLFVIEFQDFLSKSKFYRMALNSEDMAQLLGIKFYPDDRQDIFIRVMRRIVCHIRFDHETFYSMPYLQFGEVWYRPYLDVPLRNRVKDGGRREQGEGGLKFSNKIMKHTFEKENMNKTKLLMEGYRKSVRIIFHRTFIHKNEFYILTIQKNLLLPEFWMLFIYSLKTGRRLMGYVQSKDVEQIQFTDLSYNQTLFRLFDQGQPFQKYKSFLDAVETKSFDQRHIFIGNEKSNFFVQSIKRLNEFEPPLTGKSEGEESEQQSPDIQQYPQKICKSQFQSEDQTPVSQRQVQPASMSDSSQQQSVIQYQNQQQSQSQSQSASQLQVDQMNQMHQYLSYSKHAVLPQLPIDQSFLLNFQKLTQQQTDMSLSIPKPISDLKQQGVQHVDSFNESEEAQTKIFLLEKFIQLTNQLSRASKQFSAPSPRLNFLARFVEIKTWEDIADKMILNNKGATHTMQFGNVAVPMQEYISSAQIMTDSGQEIMVEYFIGKQKDKKGGESLLTESFEEISYPATLGYYIYLRFYYFNQVGIVHKKINLRELLNLFIADGYYKYQTNYMHSKLQQQDLNQLCDFVSYKIRSGTFSSLLNSNQFQFRRTGLESYSRKTLQTLVKEQEQEEVENSIAERFVFSQKPYRIVKVYIKLTKRIVEFLIYSPQNASTFKKKYQIQSLYQHIPFIGFYFQAGLYRQLAKNFLSLLDSDLKFHFKKFLKERITAPL